MFTHPLIQSVVSYVGFMFGAPAVTGPLFVDNALGLSEVATATDQDDEMDSPFYGGSINRRFDVKDVFENEDSWTPTGRSRRPAPGSARFDRFGDFA